MLFRSEYPLQNPEILSKVLEASFSFKSYILPSGEEIFIQGYEHFGLDKLFRENYDEKHIITGIKNVPEIKFLDEMDKKAKQHPDLYIEPEKRCIEVKSIYTFELRADRILRAQQEAKKLGYKYEIWIFDGKDPEPAIIY